MCSGPGGEAGLEFVPVLDEAVVSIGEFVEAGYGVADLVGLGVEEAGGVVEAFVAIGDGLGPDLDLVPEPVTIAFELAESGFGLGAFTTGGLGFGMGMGEAFAEVVQIGLESGVCLLEVTQGGGEVQAGLFEAVDVEIEGAVGGPLGDAEGGEGEDAEEVEEVEALHGRVSSGASRISKATRSMPAARTQSRTRMTSPWRAS